MSTNAYVHHLISTEFTELCSVFLNQTVVGVPPRTLDNLFEMEFNRLYDIQLNPTIQRLLGSYLGSEPQATKNYIRMLIKKTVNPPQTRSADCFDHLHLVRGEGKFDDTASRPAYHASVCIQYIDVLIRHTLRFIKTCIPAKLHLITDAMTMDIVTYIISDIAYGLARRDFEEEYDHHCSAIARRIGRVYRREDITLVSTLKRFTSLIRSQMVEGIVIRARPVFVLPPRIKIHLPSSGDVFMLGRPQLFDVKKSAYSCKPGDDAGEIRKKDGSDVFVWDQCQHLTGYLCPSATSTTEELDIVFTPGHNDNISAAPGLLYASVSRADMVSSVLQDGVVQISSYLSSMSIFDDRVLRPLVTDVCEKLNEPEFIDDCLDKIAEDACFWWNRDRVRTEMEQFSLSDELRNVFE